MSKKILILSASPRKGGNSDLLCDEFMRGAHAAGHDCKKVMVAQQEIHYCTGCGVCNETHVCVQKDGMADILADMVAADVIVLATPVYFYTMDAQLKTLIDRTAPRYTEIRDKDFYYILTAADEDDSALDKTIEGLRGFTLDCLPGTREKGIVRGVGVWGKGEVRGKPILTQAYEMGTLA